MGVAVALLGVALLGPLSLLAAIGETRAGRLVGLLAIALLAAIACGLLAMRPQGRGWGWAAGASALIALILGVVAVRSAPATGPGKETGLQARLLGGKAGRLPAEVLPEIDQVKLGAAIATRLAPGMGGGMGRRLREVTLRLAREVEADPAARGLGSVAHLGLVELLGGEFDIGHYYAYVPEHAPGEALGAVVFLHGNGGNFKIMPWAWRSFAERGRFVIVCPTFGFGFWDTGGVEAVEAARADAVARLPIDPGRVYLGGISDGGKGVTRSAAAHPDRYRGLIYISPTMLEAELSAPTFVRGWRGRPILVVQGDRDFNVRKATVDPAVDLLRRQGAEVLYRVFPGEDHSLFFGRRDEVFDLIQGWMAGASRGATEVDR